MQTEGRVRVISIDYMSPCSKGSDLVLRVEGAVAAEEEEEEGGERRSGGSGVSFPNLSSNLSLNSRRVPTSYSVLFTRKSDGWYLTQCQVHFDPPLPALGGGGGGGWVGRRRSRL